MMVEDAEVVVGAAGAGVEDATVAVVVAEVSACR